MQETMSRTRLSLQGAIIALALFSLSRFTTFYCEVAPHRTAEKMRDTYVEDELHNRGDTGKLTQTNFLSDHWVRVVDSMPLHKSYMLQVHHVCTDGGRSGLVVPHIGSALQALRSDQRYLPNSSYPTAFRAFTDEESLQVFSGAPGSTRWVRMNKMGMGTRMNKMG
jgi:hypothetical protein